MNISRSATYSKAAISGIATVVTVVVVLTGKGGFAL
jgi:hypothetical protein